MPHHYVKLEGTALWNALELAIKDLVLNRDIVESTARPYIVGYLCQKILKVEECVRLRSIYELRLGRGPYPTFEVSPQRFPEREPGTISMYLADIAGIASHGEKLLNLENSPRRVSNTRRSKFCGPLARYIPEDHLEAHTRPAPVDERHRERSDTD
jgi:hypothetical protein